MRFPWMDPWCRTWRTRRPTWLAVEVTFKVPSIATPSQAQPLPKRPKAALEKASKNHGARKVEELQYR